MKKIIAFLVVLLMAFSILPIAVFAHEDEISDSSDGTYEGESSDEEVRTREHMSVSGVSDFGGDASHIVTDLEIDVKEKHKALRANFVEAKIKFVKAKNALLEQRVTVKDKIVAAHEICEEDAESEDCLESKEEAEATAKDYILSAVDAIEHVLEKRKAKLEEIVSKIESSDLEDKEEMLVKLNARLGEINARLELVADLKARAETVENKEDIKDLAKELRSIWKSTKVDLSESSGHVLASRFAFVIHRAEALENKLEHVLDKLEAGGIDTSSVNVESFEQHIARAKVLVEQAKTKFAEEGDKETNVKEGHKLLVEAHAELKLAHQDLKTIVSSLKSVGAEEEVESLSEEDSENEDEEETEVEVSGDLELSDEARATLDGLVASFENAEGDVELRLKVKKSVGEVSIERNEVEGVLTSEQEALWNTLGEQVVALLESADGEDLELEVEIEHELEVESEEHSGEVETDEETEEDESTESTNGEADTSIEVNTNLEGASLETTVDTEISV